MIDRTWRERKRERERERVMSEKVKCTHKERMKKEFKLLWGEKVASSNAMQYLAEAEAEAEAVVAVAVAREAEAAAVTAYIDNHH